MFNATIGDYEDATDLGTFETIEEAWAAIGEYVVENDPRMRAYVTRVEPRPDETWTATYRDARGVLHIQEFNNEQAAITCAANTDGVYAKSAI